MLSLLLATLLTQATMSPTSNLSTNRVRATGASVTRTLRDHLRTLPDVAWDAVNTGSASVTATGSATPMALHDWAAWVNAQRAGGNSGAVDDAPFAVIGGRLATSIGLRAPMKMRSTSGGYDHFGPGLAYGTGLFLRDFYHGAKPFPGMFDATYLRNVLNSVDITDTAYNDTPAYGALLVALTHRRGDSTVMTVKGDQAKAALDALPRTATGLVYVNPGALPAAVWGFEDRMVLSGGVGMLSALVALGYRELADAWADMGDFDRAVTARAAFDAMVSALRTLRRLDGFYGAATSDTVPQVMLTGLIASRGMCSEREAKASGAALASAYHSGLISLRGGIRHLVKPNVYTSTNPTTAPGSYQNGGYWLGEWTAWVAQAMRLAGYERYGSQLMQEATDELLREHRIDASAPREYFVGPATYGSGLSAAAGGFLAYVTEPEPGELTAVLSGAASSSAIVSVPRGHEIIGAEAICATTTTATIDVTAAQRISAENELDLAIQPTVAFGTESTIGTITLSSSKGAVMAMPVRPAGVFGGYVKVTVASGSSTGPITVRLVSTRAAPSLAGQSPWTDTFATDTLASYYLSSGGWQITAGRLENVNSSDGQVALAPVIAQDIEVVTTVSRTGVGHYGFVTVRAVNANNCIFLNADTVVSHIYDRTNGVNTLLGSIAVGVADATDTKISLRVVGDQVTGTVAGTSTTVTSLRPIEAGRAGAYLSGGGPTSYDAITVTGLDVAPPAAYQPIPPGFLFDKSVGSAYVNGEDYSGSSGVVYLRDERGFPVASTSSANASVLY